MDLLGSLVLLIDSLYGFGLFALAIALFWHMKRIGKAGIAEILWWLIFLPIATVSAIGALDAYAKGSAITVVLPLITLSAVAAARWFNPLPKQSG